MAAKGSVPRYPLLGKEGSGVVWIILLIVVGLIALVFFQYTPTPASFEHEALVAFPNGNEILVAVADTDAQRRAGLSGYESIREDEGMLFIHDTKQIPHYWMKGMKFALDFVWIDGDTIVDLTENVPPVFVPTKRYYPDLPVDRVLEVNAGFIEKNGLSVGDNLDIEFFDK